MKNILKKKEINSINQKLEQSGNKNLFVAFVINCLLHIFILFLFLTLFFFIYIKNVEDNNYAKIVNIYGNSLDKYLNSLSDNEKEGFCFILNKNPIDLNNIMRNNKSPNEYVLMNNKWLERICIIVLSTLLFIIFLIIFIMNFIYKKNINIFEILLENLIVSIIVGTIEVGFFIFVAQNYVVTTPSTIGDAIINDLEKNLNN